MTRKKDYESMTNKELLETALRKGLSVSVQERNGLSIVRGVAFDPRGLADRQAFIGRLSAYDERRQSNLAMKISLVAAAAAVVGLIDAFVR